MSDLLMCRLLLYIACFILGCYVYKYYSLEVKHSKIKEKAEGEIEEIEEIEEIVKELNGNGISCSYEIDCLRPSLGKQFNLNLEYPVGYDNGMLYLGSNSLQFQESIKISNVNVFCKTIALAIKDNGIKIKQTKDEVKVWKEIEYPENEAEYVLKLDGASDDS